MAFNNFGDQVEVLELRNQVYFDNVDIDSIRSYLVDGVDQMHANNYNDAYNLFKLRSDNCF